MAKQTMKNSSAFVIDKEFDQNMIRNGRVFLKDAKKFAEFPELLGMQQKGFQDFVEHYLTKLFEEINPIHDI
jgi:DNA-directed RNA polymerase beta subunit